MTKNKMCVMLKCLLVLGLLFASDNECYSASVENLDEVVNRKSRRRLNTFYSGEGASPSYFWQPQSLCYTDVTTGAEIWKLSNLPAISAIHASDINVPTWSADGKRLSLRLTMQDALNVHSAALTNENNNNMWMLTDSTGSRLRPIVGGPSATTGQMQWFPWNPVESDSYYMFGRPYYGVTGVYSDRLYKAKVTDTAITRTEWLNYSGTLNAGSQMLTILINGISPDGKKAVVSEGYTSGQYNIYPSTLHPAASKAVDTKGYSQNIDHDATYWGNTPTVINKYHSDQAQLALIGGVYRYIAMPGGSSTQWLFDLVGSGTNGAPVHILDHTSPYNFGEAGPLNVATGNNPYPSSHYVSHPALDRWGKYLIYSDGETANAGAFDVVNKKIYKNVYGEGSQHHAYTAWSDYFVAAHGPVASSNDYTPDKLFIAKFNADNSYQDVCYPHTLFNNGYQYNGASNEYSSLPRPVQSPDGTKISFHSTFLNAKVGVYDNAPDIYWAVAYFPYPPEIISAAKNGSNIRLAWDFNQGGIGNPNLATPRTYATRGWPNETTDRPPSPREIDKFRVWISSDNINWTPLGTTHYNNCRGTNECGMWTETEWMYESAQPVSSTRYYALTSLEHSGLESHTLSNTWKVTLNSDGNITQNSQQSAYPANPGGKSSFYTTKPGGPVEVVFSHKTSPAIADGQYTITWKSSTDNSLIRYYNIYAADGSVPATVQQQRIASIPVTSDYTGSGSYKYIDWLGATDGTTKYVVTSVDFQGNESVVSWSKPPRLEIIPNH